MEFCHRPGTAPGPVGDRPSPPAGEPTPITVKVRTRAKSTTSFSLSKPVPGFKTGYWFSGSRLTSLVYSALCQTQQTDLVVATFILLTSHDMIQCDNRCLTSTQKPTDGQLNLFPSACSQINLLSVTH